MAGTDQQQIRQDCHTKGFLDPSLLPTHLVLTQSQVSLEFPIDLLHGPSSLVTNGVSLLQTNKHNSTCWSYYHGHTLPPSGAKACNPARNGGRYGHPRFYHGLILPGR